MGGQQEANGSATLLYSKKKNSIIGEIETLFLWRNVNKKAFKKSVKLFLGIMLAVNAFGVAVVVFITSQKICTLKILSFGYRFLVVQANFNIFNTFPIYYALSSISRSLLFSIQPCRMWCYKGILFCCNLLLFSAFISSKTYN